MKALQTLWNTLESSVFRFSPSKASSAIFLVIITQLAISVPMLFLLYNIKALAGASEEMAAIATGAGRCIFISYAGLLIITVLSLCIWKMIGYLATKPLQTVDAIFHRMVDGQADWSEDLKSLPYPELKHVSTGYNTLMNDLRNIIEEMRKAGIRIAIGSAHVLKAVNLAGHKANEQKEISGMVAASSDDSSTAIHEISGNTNYVSQNTSTNLNQVRTSFNELENVAQKVESINRTMTSFSETIEELNRNSAGIMEIIAVINDMSDQTNLLSLNATIEAARAGEYGKGFAVVAEEVRSLAKQIKPATEDISEKISQMIATVDKTKAESNTIIDASMEVNTIISETAGNFESMIGDFEETNEQLLKIAAAIEELSLTNEEINKKVTDINTLSNEVFIDMESSEKKVQEFAEITEEMQDKAAHYRTGRGTLDRVILLVQRHRDHMQEVLSKLSQQGVNIFDENYRPIPDTNPAKFTTAFTDPLRKEIQEYVDTTLKEIPGCIYCIPVDRKGYLAVHHSHVSKPITGDYEKDLLQSRHMRFFFATRTDQRRVTSTAPMLLQTYMRDTGEVLNDLSMPITINGRHWGGYIVGLLPEVLTE